MSLDFQLSAFFAWNTLKLTVSWTIWRLGAFPVGVIGRPATLKLNLWTLNWKRTPTSPLQAPSMFPSILLADGYASVVRLEDTQSDNCKFDLPQLFTDIC